MPDYFSLDHITKKFGSKVALDDISLRVTEPSIIGLVGKNGSGKTTLLRHVPGLYLPTKGTATTFGTATVDLSPDHMARLGMSHQHDELIEWMSARRILRYVASFHARWDRELENRLVELLEVDPGDRIDTMSPGMRQKVSLILAVCHHPALLLLDEPISDLDPIVRRDVMEAVLDRFRTEEVAIVISAHLLHDVERVANRIVCMDRGRIIADAPLDELIEGYAEWTVTSATAGGTLPARFPEAYIVSQESDGRQARLTVRDPARNLPTFRAAYAAEVRSEPLNLDRIFRVLVGAHEDGRGSQVDTRPRNAGGTPQGVAR
jgi:ABC-2 type transport system ATP-binding protein